MCIRTLVSRAAATMVAIPIFVLVACGGNSAPASPPNSPTAVIAVAGNSQATVTFLAPTNDGGSPVTGYTVTSNPKDGTDSNAGGTVLTHIVTDLVNGYSYVFSATASNAVGFSNPSSSSLSVIPTTIPVNGSGLWGIASNMQVDRIGHTSNLMRNGKILVVGGVGNGEVLASAELYNPVTSKWEPAGPLVTGRQNHTSTLLMNGKVLVTGGSNSNGYQSLSSAELYDPSTNRWSPAGSLQHGRTMHGAVMLPSGKVLVMAGDAGGTSLQDSFYPHPLASAEIFDVVSNAWSPAASLTVARWWHAAALLPNGKVLVSGGATTDGKHALPYAGADVYDSLSNTWVAAGALTWGRFGHTATALPNGSILAAGGFGTLGILESSEIYEPVNNSWRIGGQLSTPRSSHTSTLLPTGQVLIAGGRTFVSIADADLYSFGSNSWVGTGAMTTSRESHSATLLADGTVLVTGGYSSITQTTVSRTEIYSSAVAK